MRKLLVGRAFFHFTKVEKRYGKRMWRIGSARGEFIAADIMNASSSGEGPARISSFSSLSIGAKLMEDIFRDYFFGKRRCARTEMSYWDFACSNWTLMDAFRGNFKTELQSDVQLFVIRKVILIISPKMQRPLKSVISVSGSFYRENRSLNLGSCHTWAREPDRQGCREGYGSK